MKVKIKRKFCSYSDGQKVSAEETAFDFYGRELFGDGFFVCADCKRSYCRFMVVLSDGNELLCLRRKAIMYYRRRFRSNKIMSRIIILELFYTFNQS